MPGHESSKLTRRTFLAASAGLVLAVACGSDDDSSDDDSSDGAPTPGAPSKQGRALVAFFPPQPAGPLRLPFGVGDQDGVLLKEGPRSLVGQFATIDGRPIGPAVTVARHDRDLQRAYYPFTTTEITSPGNYQLITTIDGNPVSAAFTVKAPAEIKVPKIGDALRSVDTPTTANARGVTPICTREPMCPLHNVSLADAMKQGKPIALLIATPLFCSTAICGPVLDVLMKQQSQFGDRVTFIHAEVFTDKTDRKQLTSTVSTYGLDYEPALFLADASGKVTDRLDVIFDTDELASALARLTR